MTERAVTVPDVGEGVAEAELVEWHVAIGDTVAADDPLAEVMTDKATVEIPSPVGGTVTWLAGEPGEVIAVGGDLVRIATGDVSDSAGDATDDSGGAAPAATEPVVASEPESKPEPGRSATRELDSAPLSTEDRAEAAPIDNGDAAPRPHHDVTSRPQAAPAVRLRAREAGVDLRRVAGSGPAGRITHADLDGYLADAGHAAPLRRAGAAPGTGDDSVEDVKVIGLRRRIAQAMAEANTHVPHITYVEEVDLTLLQQLRSSINDDAERPDDQPRLTLLPFILGALVGAVRAHPQCNAHYDDGSGDDGSGEDGSSGAGSSGAGVVRVHRGVHVGIATQTDNGLVVPVLRHAESHDVFSAAAEIDRLATAARDGSATSAELSGSTITITSLGAIGGIVTTPIINRPEVAIVGVNKVQTKPVWNGSTFEPRQVMNLSSSFDHRIVDGWDAAKFVQLIKRRLEAPARLLGGAFDV